MNGRTHAAIGAASMTGAALSGIHPASCALMTVVAAGFALGPDIDHPGSTISKSMPKTAHRIAHGVSRVARSITMTRADKKASAWRASRGHDPDHRAFTHTAVTAALAGGVAAGVVSLTSLGTLVLVTMAAWWSIRLWKFLMPFLAASVVLASLAPLDPLLAAWAAGAGWLSHIIADGCTKSGVPLMWPLKIRGKRWYSVRLLGSSIASGDRREWLAGLAVAALMNSPILIF